MNKGETSKLDKISSQLLDIKILLSRIVSNLEKPQSFLLQKNVFSDETRKGAEKTGKIMGMGKENTAKFFETGFVCTCLCRRHQGRVHVFSKLPRLPDKDVVHSFPLRR